MLFYLQAQIPTSSIIEQYADSIATAVVILLFIIERFLSAKQQKKERKLNWYFSVIVLPHINTINEFFEQYSKSMEEAHDTISHTALGPEGIIQIKAAYFHRLAKLISGFKFQFLISIMLFDVHTHDALDTILQELHDEVIEGLDASPLSNKDNVNIIIRNKKSVFFHVLYKHIK